MSHDLYNQSLNSCNIHKEAMDGRSNIYQHILENNNELHANILMLSIYDHKIYGSSSRPQSLKR